jgi:hypothetical protein
MVTGPARFAQPLFAHPASPARDRANSVDAATRLL